MYTQCSNCKTLFRITEEQLAAVQGKVRCGFCYSTFDASQALFEDIPDLSEADDEDDASEATASQQEAINTAPPRVVAPTAAPPPPRQPPPPPEPSAPPRPVAPAPVAAPIPVETAHRAVPAAEPPPPVSPAASIEQPGEVRRAPPPPIAPSPPAAAPPAHASADAVPTPSAQNPNAPAAQATRRTIAATEPRAATPTAASESAPRIHVPTVQGDAAGVRLPSLFDAIDLAGHALQQVSRRHLDTHRSAGGGANDELRANMPWLVGTMLLLALIVVQYSYLTRNDLARFTALRPWLESMCAVTGCSIPLMRNPLAIKLVSRDIRTHPTAKDALQVRARIVNDAPYTQSYPLLRVDLSDISGAPVASRLFRPEEYLRPGTDIAAGIPSRGHADVELDILDPSHRATGFEFAFL
jgi:predicted Zn finger-like uncharacterized protein